MPPSSIDAPDNHETGILPLIPTHAITTVVSSISQQVGAALSDNKALIQEFRMGSKIDHPTG